MAISDRRAPLLVAGVLLGAATDCRCIEHPLYDAKANRFDTWYLGGGNTQYRPFRSVAYGPAVRFDVELRVREADDDDPALLVVAARIGGEDAPDVEGEVVARFGGAASAGPVREELLASFDHVDDDLSLARIDRDRLHQLADDGVTIVLRFSDASTGTATLELDPDALLEPAHDRGANQEVP
jgi:hypothetical protein